MKPQPSLHFRGIGTGYLQYIGYYLLLKKHYDLSGVSFSGCSSGAYTAAVMALDLSPIDAVVLPFLSQSDNFKSLAFVGKWKGMLQGCLEQLLPIDRDYSGLRNLEIGIQYLDKYELVKAFDSRQDLMACLLSSAHIPFLVNYRPFDRYRGKYCFDPEFIGSYPIPEERLLISVDLPRKVRFSPKTKPQLFDMVARGYRAAMKDSSLGTYLKELQVGAISEEALFEYWEALRASLASQ